VIIRFHQDIIDVSHLIVSSLCQLHINLSAFSRPFQRTASTPHNALNVPHSNSDTVEDSSPARPLLVLDLDDTLFVWFAVRPS
jgi:hypothetical protein